MRKFFLSMLLCMCLIIGLLTGCVSNSDEASKPANSSTPAPTQESKPEEVTEKPVSLRMVLYGDAGQRGREFLDGEFHDKV
ncbi:MAG: hypothetical protein GX783_14445, partial [Clostridiales bacterium]|nr:hypothetical protein [Clostridiales bacterium]